MGSQTDPAASDICAGDAPPPYRFMLRLATSPAATDAQIAAARAMTAGAVSVVTGNEEWTMWHGHIASAWHGDAAVRCSWLPARLPQVLSMVRTIRQSDRAGATLVGRAAGSGVLRLAGDTQALAAAVSRLRTSPDVGNVAVLRAPRALKEIVDVWGPPRDSDTVLRSLKQMFDPAGILNA